jgi:hypothetical protein
MTLVALARPLAALLTLVLALSLGACKDRQSETQATPPVSAVAPFRVTALALGNAIDANKNVASPMAVFDAGDTIYAVVSSEGSAPNVILVARWTYEDGQVVSESKQTIAPTGPAATEFHIAKPDGWPPGKYQVEISANGSAVQTQAFEVR